MASKRFGGSFSAARPMNGKASNAPEARRKWRRFMV
jgi:hypothetical protein